jgi:aryl-alcohol dehydrogenase
MEVEAAVVREHGGPFRIETLELDPPRADEVLVEIVAVGYCHADVVVRDQIFPGDLPAVFGHEGAGIVREVGRAVTDVEPGDPVVLTYDFDGACPNCRRGRMAYCDHFFEHNFVTRRPEDGSTPLSKDGEPIEATFFGQSSFSSHALARERNVVKVPDDAPLERLGPLGCGVQTGAGAVINTLAPEPGSTLAIFGAGSVGLSALLGANLVGVGQVIAIDLQPDRLHKALELGAHHKINPRELESVADAIRSIEPRGVDFSLETTGQPDVLRNAVECLAPGGTCGVIGAPPFGTNVSLDVNHLLNGRTVQGIVEGDSIPKAFIPELVEFHLEGRLPFDAFVSFYDFEDINEAVEDAESGEVIKPILQIRSGDGR